MKSISTYIKEATEKVELAVNDRKAYDEYNDSVKDFSYEERCRILELSEKSKASFKSAAKAVKDLYVLFDLDEPKLKFEYHLIDAIYHVTRRWEFMNRNID